MIYGQETRELFLPINSIYDGSRKWSKLFMKNTSICLGILMIVFQRKSTAILSHTIVLRFNDTSIDKFVVGTFGEEILNFIWFNKFVRKLSH